MSEPTQKSHWDSLLTELGATPPAQEEEPRQPPPSVPPRPYIPKSDRRPKRPASPPPSPASWDALASELGIQPAPTETSVEPSAPLSAAAASDVSAMPLERAGTDSPRAELASVASAEESPNFYDEPFDFEEPFDLLESTEGMKAPPPGSEKPQETEKRSRKRRRRRRPGRGDSAHRDAAREQASASPSPRAADAAYVAELGDRQTPSAGNQDEVRRDQHGSPRQEKGRLPKDIPSSDGGCDRPLDASKQDFLDKDLAGGDEQHSDEELQSSEQTARMGFRGIPTWQETVGLLVAKNLESRAKRSGGGSQHGRGNRNSHENRSGRGDERRRS